MHSVTMNCNMHSFKNNNIGMKKTIAGIDTDLFVLASIASMVFLYGFIYYPSMDIDDIYDTMVAKDPYCILYDEINCANGGLLVKTTENGFTCKCTENYYGENCKNAKLFTSISWLLRVFYNPGMEILSGKPTMWWSFLPFTSDIQLKTIYRFHQNNMKKLKIFSDIRNDHEEGLKISMSSLRILPPTHPLHCLENKKLPPLMALYDIIFKRKHDQFKPDPKHRNLLYQAFYQYFVLQFFDTNFNLTVTASQLYGSDKITKRELRSFSNGKLKTKCLKKEQYPPYLSYAKHVQMVYYPTKPDSQTHWFNKIIMDSKKAKSSKWAMGHPLLSMNPMLFVMSTLWVREHNRVCDILLRLWPAWTDDQIYMTASKIVIGQMTRIMMNDVMNVVHPYSLKHKPELFYDLLQNINSSNTPIELILISMGSSSLPDNFKNVTMDSVLFGNNRHVLDDGMSDTIKYMVGQEMGMITHNNDGTATRPLTKLMLELSRENALQSFNNYRRSLGLYPYEDFYGLTNNWETVSILKSLYDNVEDVELLTGMLMEKRSTGIVPTVAALTNSIIINSILTNSLSSKDLWRRDTFGGNVGFDIVKTANIESFICNNLADKCDGFKVKLYAN